MFSPEFCEVSKNTFSQNTSWRLLLDLRVLILSQMLNIITNKQFFGFTRGYILHQAKQNTLGWLMQGGEREHFHRLVIEFSTPRNTHTCTQARFWNDLQPIKLLPPNAFCHSQCFEVMQPSYVFDWLKLKIRSDCQCGVIYWLTIWKVFNMITFREAGCFAS